MIKRQGKENYKELIDVFALRPSRNSILIGWCKKTPFSHSLGASCAQLDHRQGGYGNDH